MAEEDRLSNLPNAIIHHILSFLDMKYAIQTSALSKRWKHIWTSMPHLNLNSRTFRTLPKFVKFVNDALSHRNHLTKVSAVELSFTGATTQFDSVVTSIVNHASLRDDVRKLNIEWFRPNNGTFFKFPEPLFSSHTLKHLSLATYNFYGHGLLVPITAWDFPALETLNLSKLVLSDCSRSKKSLDLFSKCVNLKDLTLHRCCMLDLDVFNVCAPKLSNLTITEPYFLPKVLNVVAPQLENLTASVGGCSSSFLHLSKEDLNYLEKVNLSMQRNLFGKERYGPGLRELFRKLSGAKILILDEGIIEVLSACLDQLSCQPCPFNNLKYLTQKEKERIPIMPIKVRKYLLESSPSATFVMDLPQVPHKADNGTMANTLDKEKQQTKTMDKEKRTLEEKILMQDKLIIEKNAKLEASKLQNEKIVMEAKILAQDKIIAQQKLEEKMQMQDKVIAEQKVMLETMKLQIFEAKILSQDKIIAQQKAMLEAMKLQHEKIETELSNIDG